MKNNLDILGYNPNFMENISKNIKKFREEANLSRADLAKMIGVSEDFLKKIEIYLGEKEKKKKTLYKISLVLDIPINKFFYE